MSASREKGSDPARKRTVREAEAESGGIELTQVFACDNGINAGLAPALTGAMVANLAGLLVLARVAAARHGRIRAGIEKE